MIRDLSNKHWRGRALVIAIFLGVMVLATVSFAQGPATIRPIDDFLNAQGTFCFRYDVFNDPDICEPISGNEDCCLFVPPIANFIGWSDYANELGASVDYAGLADDYLGNVLGTEFSGTVIERPLPDGRAQVQVILKTENALTWVVDNPDDFRNGQLLFGDRAGGAEPALGDSLLEVKFINTAPGAQLPDLMQLAWSPEPGQELLFIGIRARAKGELHELFGVPEGTPGRTTVVQTGLFMTSFMGAVADGFPVERVDLKVVGK